MKILQLFLLTIMVVCAVGVVGQPVYTFSVKIGIDCQSVDSLGGRERVVELTEDMFRRINRAFNNEARMKAIYNFVVDWDAFYIYDAISADEIRKPHPDHDYLVIMDGYKSDPREVGGGWYGDDFQTIYHSRTHNDRFNSPFEPNAIDGIIHEFGHARGVPDIYAMKVDADKNPINSQSFGGVRCIMNYPYGEQHWSDYAANMIDLGADRNIDIDDLVFYALPKSICVEVVCADGRAAKGAVVRFYPVRWYTYAVKTQVEASGLTNGRGCCVVPVSTVFKPEKEFGLRYCNALVEAEYEGVKTYGWMPLYMLQNAFFDGQKQCVLKLRVKGGTALTRNIALD